MEESLSKLRLISPRSFGSKIWRLSTEFCVLIARFIKSLNLTWVSTDSYSVYSDLVTLWEPLSFVLGVVFNAHFSSVCC